MKSKYRILGISEQPVAHDPQQRLYSITVRPEGQPQAPTQVLQVESARQPYPQGVLVDLCPDWIMTT